VIRAAMLAQPRIRFLSALGAAAEFSIFEVYEAANPRNRTRVLECNPYRATREASIELGVSQDKLRAHSVPGSLDSLGLA